MIDQNQPLLPPTFPAFSPTAAELERMQRPYPETEMRDVTVRRDRKERYGGSFVICALGGVSALVLHALGAPDIVSALTMVGSTAVGAHNLNTTTHVVTQEVKEPFY